MKPLMLDTDIRAMSSVAARSRLRSTSHGPSAAQVGPTLGCLAPLPRANLQKVS